MAKGARSMQLLMEFQDLTRRFERDDYFLQASGSLSENEILAVRGPSGSGKSTLLKILARLLAPDTGTMFYKGEAYQQIPPQKWRREIQYLSQKPVVFAGSVLDNFRMPFTLNCSPPKLNYSQDQALSYLEAVGLSTAILQQSASTLSGGEAARIALIRSLLVQPSILLLDEPTAYLDDYSAGQVMQLLNTWLAENNQRGLVIVSHKQEDLKGFNRVKFLDL